MHLQVLEMLTVCVSSRAGVVQRQEKLWACPGPPFALFQGLCRNPVKRVLLFFMVPIIVIRYTVIYYVVQHRIRLDNRKLPLH